MDSVHDLADGGRSATAGRNRQRARSFLLAMQMALAVLLIAGAGLLLQSFRRLRAVDPGVNPAGVLVVQIGLGSQRYDSLARAWRFYDDVLRRVRQFPGVVAAGASEALPLMDTYGCTVQGFEQEDMQILAESRTNSCAGMAPTSPGYFEALGMPVLEGRGFTAGDNERPENATVIVSKAFAERFWQGRNALGRSVQPFNSRTANWYHVVGVVGDVRPAALSDDPALAIYYPVVAAPGGPRWSADLMYLVVRTTAQDPMTLLPDIRRAVHEVDPAIPLGNAELMQTIVDRSMSRLTFTMLLLGVAAAVALLLAAIGLYGVVSYVVARRTGEIGVRIALGAEPWQVEWMVISGSIKLAVIGSTMGLLASLGLARVLSGLLFGIHPADLGSHLASVSLLIGVAVLATWVPARRAAKVDPIVALRK